MSIFTSIRSLVCLFFVVAFGNPAFSQDSKQESLRQEAKAAWSAASAAAQLGPATVSLRNMAKIDLPANAAFVPAEQANRVMKALGNSDEIGRVGLIVPTEQSRSWLIDLVWVGEGYVRDGEAKDWEPDAMLESLRAGTEEQNKDRTARGMPAMDIIGWVEKPVYDKINNRLVWSLAARDRGAPSGEVETVNYNTYALGREGYFSLDLIAGSDTINSDKIVVREVLGSLHYNDGKRYADFNGSTDKVAAYGIAALVGAVAVKKLGLLAVIGVFLLKIWKIGLIFAVAGFAAIKRFFARLFGRKLTQDEWSGEDPVHDEPVAHSNYGVSEQEAQDS